VVRVLAEHRHRCAAIDHGHQQLHVDQQLDWSSLQPTSGNHGHFGYPSTYVYWWTEHAWRDRLHEPDDYDNHNDDPANDNSNNFAARTSGFTADGDR
jgi:hypothetical protein